MDIKSLRERIVKEFSAEWELNDPAHRADHFEEVFQCGVFINKKLELGYDEKLILFAAYFHDMYARSRDNHHMMSYHWMSTTTNPLILENLDPGETMLVAWGCQQHRASFEGTFKNQFCELINSADRGFPGDVPAMLERAIKYRTSASPELSKEEVLDVSIDHLKDKFGKGGYARYPALYIKAFGDKMQQQLDEIKAL